MIKNKTINLPKNIFLTGPYYQFSCPWGDHTTLHRDEWYVFRKLTKKQLKNPKLSEIKKMLRKISLGRIIKFRNRKDYIISQLFPDQRFSTLEKAIQFLIDNEGKLIFCT